MIPKTEISVFLALIPTIISAVLTGQKISNLNDPSYGCHWTSTTLTCICEPDAQEMIITDSVIPTYDVVPILEIQCPNLRFKAKSIQNLRNLREIHLKNIEALNFEASSLIWYGYKDKDHFNERFEPEVPSLKIFVENSHIAEISSHAFEGRINSIVFNNTTIGSIQPFAFNGLSQTQRISFNNVKIQEANFQAFKKFTTESFEMNSVEAGIIPSRFVDITVYDRFILHNCTFDEVRSSGFIVTNPNRITSIGFSNNKINQLDGECFAIATTSDVLFKENVFNVINDGAFRGIRLYSDENTNAINSPFILFNSNIFTNLTRKSLQINNDEFQVKYFKLNLNQDCECRRIEQNLNDLGTFHGEIHCLYNNNFVTVEEFKRYECSILQSHSTIFIIIGVVIALLFIIGTVLFVYYKRVYKSKKYGNETESKSGNLSIIVPDGKTYRETEIHVVIERADLLTTDL